MTRLSTLLLIGTILGLLFGFALVALGYAAIGRLPVATALITLISFPTILGTLMGLLAYTEVRNYRLDNAGK